MVDLDGAKEAVPVNTDMIFDVLKQCNLKVELGGGIRNMETIDYYMDHGISRIILGSAALNNPALVKEAVAKYGDKIAVGIDAIDGNVAAEGWTQTSTVNYIDLAKHMEDAGVKYHCLYGYIPRRHDGRPEFHHAGQAQPFGVL